MRLAAGAPEHGGHRGHSLLELLIALGIVAMLAAIAGPSYRDLLARSQLRSVATEIASELRMARQLAMARRERLRVRIDRQQQTIRVESADAATVLDVYGDKGILLAEPTAGPDLLFHPSGRSATATTIDISHIRGLRMKLTVTLTGRVTLS